MMFHLHVRERWMFRYLDEVRQDVRHTVRSLRRTPGFAIVAVVTLALGIGADTALFSVANAVLLKPLSIRHPERLVRSVTESNGVWLNSSPETFKIWKDADGIFEDVAAHRFDIVNLTGNIQPVQIGVARVSHAFLRLFDAPVVRGRAFTPEEDRPGGPAVAILSYSLWMGQFGGDESVLGRRLVLGTVPHAIVGVIGPGFNSEQFQALPDLWVPLQADPDHVDGASIYQVTARLRAGVSRAQANAHVRGVLDALKPATGTGRGGRPYTWIALPLQEAMVGSFRASITLLAGAVGLLLLIACANVAGLVLIRADVRKREIAIRAAIGAGRGRILRQLMIESVVLSLAGGAVGIIIGPLIVRSFVGLYPAANPFMIGADEALPRLGEAAGHGLLDWRVLSFAFVVSVAAGIVSGLLPAWHVVRALSHSTLQETNAPTSGMRWRTARAGLVLTELSLALMLVVGAGLLIRTSLAMRSVDPGFDPNHVLTLRMAVTGTKFERRDGLAQLAREGLTRVEAVPGVIRASTTCCMPLETVWQLPFVIASRAGEGLITSGAMSFHGMGGWTFVSPGYFDVFHIPVLRGRDFSAEDDARAPGVVIINEAMARRYWPNSDPLNDRLIIGRGMRAAYADDPIRQIIGVVGNVHDTGLTRNVRPAVYVPMAQVPDAVTITSVKLLPIVWIARTADDPYRVSAPVERALESTIGLPVGRLRAMRDVMSESTARNRFDMWLMTAFAVCALVLCAVGVYGLISYSVRQRTREIGIRVALGAAPGEVWRLIVRQAMSLAAAGILIGVAGSLYLVRIMTSLLFGVSPRDPVIFAIVPLLFAVVALVAACVPARTATRISPVTALRCE